MSSTMLVPLSLLLLIPSTFSLTPMTKSLFVQLSTWTWWQNNTMQLQDNLDAICKNHRQLGQPGRIENIILQDVARRNDTDSSDPLIEDLLNVVLSYFPGGNGPCTFDNAFVGTVDLQV